MTCRKSISWQLLFLGITLLSARETCAAKSTAIVVDPVYTRSSTLIAIEAGRRLNIYCVGKGSPTVLFDAGLGDGTKAWALVQPAVGARTRACSYDRAGLGFSDPGSRPGTSANIVDDLHRLFDAAGIKPPYVLVGHSFGGMNVKLYAQKYRADVAGMVLVDPSHEDQARLLWGLDPAYEAKFAPYMETLRTCLRAAPADFIDGSDLYKSCVGAGDARYSEAINATELNRARLPGRMKSWISEQENIWFASADQVRVSRRPLGNMPIIVLSKEPSPRFGTETQELRDAKNRGMAALHEQIAGLSTRGVRRVVEDAGHYIQLDQPETVVDAVLEVLRDVSNKNSAAEKTH